MKLIISIIAVLVLFTIGALLISSEESELKQILGLQPSQQVAKVPIIKPQPAPSAPTPPIVQAPTSPPPAPAASATTTPPPAAPGAPAPAPTVPSTTTPPPASSTTPSVTPPAGPSQAQIPSITAPPTITPTPGVTPPIPSAPSVPLAPATPTKEKLTLATIGRGEGIEHAFQRQMKADPKEFGFDGDVSDQKAVKKWAGIEAHRLAIKAGYVALDGREIRIKVADKVAYLLYSDKDGNLMVAEYEKDSQGKFAGSPSDEGPVRKSYDKAQFEGDTTDGVQSYEYIFTASVKTAAATPTVSMSSASVQSSSTNLQTVELGSSLFVNFATNIQPVTFIVGLLC